MNKKYIMFDMSDQKLSVLAEVLSNKTSKQILEYLADKEASETEISRDLKLPANTVNYNIKKLVESGLIEVSKNWFWSVKGKKILRYRVANKKIIISPKSSSSSTKGILSAFIITGVAALAVKLFGSKIYSSGSGVDYATSNNYALQEGAKIAGDSGVSVVESSGVAREVAPDVANGVIQTIQSVPDIGLWFLLGGIFALVVFMILNWRRL